MKSVFDFLKKFIGISFLDHGSPIMLQNKIVWHDTIQSLHLYIKKLPLDANLE